MYVPEWWMMPDILFFPVMFLNAGYGVYVLRKAALWLMPSQRHERKIKRIEAEFKIKKRRQELELELAWKNDRYNRDKIFYDNLSKNH